MPNIMATPMTPETAVMAVPDGSLKSYDSSSTGISPLSTIAGYSSHVTIISIELTNHGMAIIGLGLLTIVAMVLFVRSTGTINKTAVSVMWAFSTVVTSGVVL